LAELFAEPRALVVLDVGRNDPGTLPDEEIDRSPPDPRGPAGNNGHFSVKTTRHSFLAVNPYVVQFDLTTRRF
jgi:hypothetical protein